MMKTKWAWLWATWFGCGLSPKAPGTAGSLAAILLAFPLAHLGLTPAGFVILSLVLLWPSIAASTVVARESGRKDPQMVVVDEVLGQWVTLAGAARLNWRSFLIAFILFRVFDILKPPPIRRIEKLKEGAGIVLDDIGAGVYAALVLFAAGWLNLY